jgi:hypothetical protein
MKGVPEADIAAAFGNPERMQQLIYRTYRPDSAQAPATTDAVWSGRTPAAPLLQVPPTKNPFAQSPKLTTQDLSAHALRMKGVSESTIAAVIDKPALLQQLTDQVYRLGNARASPANDALWSGCTPVAPVVSPPQDGPTAPPEPQGHGKSDRLPEGVPIWARPPRGNPFVASPGAVRGVPGPADRYQRAAIEEIARLKQMGVPLPAGYTRMLEHGYFLNLGLENVCPSTFLPRPRLTSVASTFRKATAMPRRVKISCLKRHGRTPGTSA